MSEQQYPVGRCNRCGVKQRFNSINALLAQNRFGSRCWDCGSTDHQEYVLAGYFNYGQQTSVSVVPDQWQSIARSVTE